MDEAAAVIDECFRPKPFLQVLSCDDGIRMFQQNRKNLEWLAGQFQP
jgi:hypothetical protein